MNPIYIAGEIYFSLLMAKAIQYFFVPEWQLIVLVPLVFVCFHYTVGEHLEKFFTKKIF